MPLSARETKTNRHTNKGENFKMPISEKLAAINAATATPVIADSDLSPSLHPDSIVPIAACLGEDDATLPAYEAGRHAQRLLYQGLNDLQTAWRETRLANVPDDQLAAAMGTKVEQVARGLDRHMTTVSNVVEKLDATIEKTLTNPKKDTASVAQAASDIRRYVLSLPEQKRMSFVHDSIVNGDAEVVQAVLATSGFVSGLDRAQTDTLRSMSREAFGGIAWQQHNAAVRLRDHLTQSATIFAKRVHAITPVIKPSRAAAAVANLKG
jgi:hypothetical protein